MKTYLTFLVFGVVVTFVVGTPRDVLIFAALFSLSYWAIRATSANAAEVVQTNPNFTLHV